MEDLLQLLFSGLAIGGIYALVAIGFVLIYKATEVVNFAQGEMMMVGAYLCFTFKTILGLSLFWAVPLTIICSALLGMIIERLFLRPLLGKPTFTIVMVTIALAAALRAIASAISSVGGILLANLTFLHPNMGFIGLKALPAAIVGGFESLSGALIGGILIGLIENLSGVYLSELTKDDEELTPTLKVWRELVEKRYKEVIDNMYG